MSEELRELAYRVIDAFNRRDKQAFLACCTEDFTMESRFSSVAGTIYEGSAGLDVWWSDLAEAWDPITNHIEELSAPPGRVTMLLHLTGSGRTSGVALDEHVAIDGYVRDGVFSRFRYLDRAEAERIVRGG